MKALEIQVLKVDKQMSTMKVSKVIVKVGRHIGPLHVYNDLICHIYSICKPLRCMPLFI